MRVRIALLATIAILLVVLAVRVIGRRMGGQAGVWTAKVPLPAGHTVQPHEVERTRVSAANLPPGAAQDAAQIVGKKIQKSRNAGESLFVSDFQEPKIWLSDRVPRGRVSVTVRAPESALPFRDLRPGVDRLDIVVTRKDSAAQVAAHDALFIGFIAAPEEPAADKGFAAATRNPRAGPKMVQLILGVLPQEVFALNDSVMTVAFVVHGAEELKSGASLRVDPPVKPRIVEFKVDVIAGAHREKVVVP